MAGKEQNQFNIRVYSLIGLFLIWSTAIGAQLVNLQIFRHFELCEMAKRQRSRVFEISPKRGTIYDRQNRELAVSISVESIYAVPSEIEDKAVAAARLASLLNLSLQELRQKLDTHRNFTWIKRKVDLPKRLRFGAWVLEASTLKRKASDFIRKENWHLMCLDLLE